MPDRMKATGRENRPITSKAPPTSSRMPEMPPIDAKSILAMLATTGNLNSLAVPCSSRNRPLAMRKILKRRGAHAVPRASKSIATSPQVSSASHHGALTEAVKQERACVLQARDFKEYAWLRHGNRRRSRSTHGRCRGVWRRDRVHRDILGKPTGIRAHALAGLATVLVLVVLVFGQRLDRWLYGVFGVKDDDRE